MWKREVCTRIIHQVFETRCKQLCQASRLRTSSMLYRIQHKDTKRLKAFPSMWPTTQQSSTGNKLYPRRQLCNLLKQEYRQRKFLLCRQYHRRPKDRRNKEPIRCKSHALQRVEERKALEENLRIQASLPKGRHSPKDTPNQVQVVHSRQQPPSTPSQRHREPRQRRVLRRRRLVKGQPRRIQQLPRRIQRLHPHRGRLYSNPWKHSARNSRKRAPSLGGA